MVCRIVSRFWGVVLRELSVLMMFDSCVLVVSWMRLFGFWWMVMLVFLVIVVWLLDRVLGWLMIGVELIVIDRLLWVMV